jgi:hypothetical protein
MTLIQVVVILIVVGILLYCVNRFIPMEATIKKIINIVVIPVVILWLCQIFGLFNALSGGPTIHPIRR